MSLIRKIKKRRERRALRVRNKMQSGLPRVSVFKSLSHIYAQIIDDSQHRTLTSFSSIQLEKTVGDKKAVAAAVGKELARKALELGVVEAAFDRGSFLYQGRIEALVNGLRDGGLRI